ncbi:MAG: sel1 repeat family protein [Succinivibrio sp.]|nr:sel1 repeat family protein [Succinivibrio sp.]
MQFKITSLFLFLCFYPFSSHSQDNTKQMELESLCNNSEGNACFALAKNYLESGKQKESVELLKKSCEFNYFPACNEVGVLLQKGEIIPTDLNQAKSYLERSCENRNVNGCQLLVDFHKSVIKKSISSPESIPNSYQYRVADRFYEIGCELNVGDACTQFGSGIEFRHFDSQDEAFSNFRKAMEYYDKACSLNSGEGCARLAKLQEGLGTHIRYYEKSCNLNCGEGCGSLGFIYFEGKEVKKDIFRAQSLFTKGCDLEDEYSCRLLGYMYKYGKGVKQSYSNAIKFMEKSCSLSVSDCGYLADFYLSGNGVRQDYKKAAELYKKACDSHFTTSACVSLGEMYYFGHGLKKDRKKAKELFGWACDMQDENGCENYSKMNRGLPLY